MSNRHPNHNAGKPPPRASAPAPEENPSARFWRLVAVPTLAGLAVVACFWLAADPAKPTPTDGEATARSFDGQRAAPLEAEADRAPRRPWPAWQPRSMDDRLVDAFCKARQRAAGGGNEYLTADPVFDVAVPVNEEEAEARQAGYLLHRARQIVKVRSGEPKPGGGWLASPGRFTLATRITDSTPRLRIKSGDRVELPSQLSIKDPAIVVEVRAGKLHALRTAITSE